MLSDATQSEHGRQTFVSTDSRSEQQCFNPDGADDHSTVSTFVLRQK